VSDITLSKIIDMLWVHPENAEWKPKIDTISGVRSIHWGKTPFQKAVSRRVKKNDGRGRPSLHAILQLSVQSEKQIFRYAQDDNSC
jgi:hypothetical protein